MKRQPVLCIRNVLIGLGVLSVLTATGLAGFGLFATGLQAAALNRIVTLEQALHNHTSADAFMGGMRTDVLRALQTAIGGNKEGEAAIRADFRHHIEVVTTALAENLRLPLTPDLHASYGEIGRHAADFTGAAGAVLELALRDPGAGSIRFEDFRRVFSSLEGRMDGTRDVLTASVREVREEGALAAAVARRLIVTSALLGVAVLVLVAAAAVRIVHGIAADLADSREEAHHLSLHDALTGLPNRALFGRRLTQALAQTRRQDGTLAMLCLDLDRFKEVNDTLGHSVGDALLRAVADRLRASVRECDTVARLGGDEFAVIQACIERTEAASALAQRLIEALGKPYDLGEHQVMIAASVGIALSSGDTADAGRLLKMADLALYRAKAAGRGQFCMFEPGMDAQWQARQTLELDLRRAVAAQDFELHYQPLVGLVSGGVIGFEALVRWRHPRGIVPPNDFIPLAEETGLIVPLGAWVLQRACADAVGWPAEVCVAVNLSAVQFRGAGLVAAVREALAASGLPPGRLELEITETALLTDTEATLAILHDLRALGVRIALDDFGTGYSSLGYLRSFPFDKIKIDQCFVRDIETSEDCKAIVRAVTGLGVSLGIATTAEGVETRAQFEHLRAEGCDHVQGFYFSRPVPMSGVKALLGAHWHAEAPAGTGPGAGATTCAGDHGVEQGLGRCSDGQLHRDADARAADAALSACPAAVHEAAVACIPVGAGPVG